MKKKAIILAAFVVVCGVLFFFWYRNKVEEEAKAAYESSYEHEVASDIIKSSKEISQRSAERQQELNDEISALEDFG